MAKFLAFSVWSRAILQIEGHINPMQQIDSSFPDVDLDPELHAYPIMLREIEEFSKFLNKQKQPSKSIALMLWVHSLRAVIRPELNHEIKNLWQLIMDSNEYWSDEIQLMFQNDRKSGIEIDFVDKTAKMANEIIRCLPPRQIFKQ